MSLPNDDLLSAAPTLYVSPEGYQLKRENKFTPRYADVRFWLAEGEGEPYPATVYVEVREYLADDPAGHWIDLGHYDATEPPDTLGTYRASDLGESE